MTDKSLKPDRAFILAAGKGTRLRPYTDTMPKPMVPINGRPLLDYTLEKLIKEGINHVTINTYYLGDRIINFAKDYQGLDIKISEERELLDTGGGAKKALENMGGKPFYLINGDALWSDNETTALARLAKHWDPQKMDILLLLQDKNTMSLTHGVGDYNITDEGLAVRAKSKDGQYMFGGIRIVSPHIFNNTPNGAFSFLELMDKAEENQRLKAIIHDGDWHHISTPEDLESVNKAFANKTHTSKSA
jgi:MurNAc alpha-1-phosphate uridylyltransferase